MTPQEISTWEAKFPLKQYGDVWGFPDPWGYVYKYPTCAAAFTGRAEHIYFCHLLARGVEEFTNGVDCGHGSDGKNVCHECFMDRVCGSNAEEELARLPRMTMVPLVERDIRARYGHSSSVTDGSV